MEEKKMYRNAIRSRQMIRSAFMELLQEKPYEKITATDIIHRADINRSTFYLHYENTCDLLRETTDYVMERFVSYFPVDANEVVSGFSQRET